MYDDAEMSNMQRITWNGIALHGGPLAGYAASHACVRMPYGFAEKLFDRTKLGMRVIISPNDTSPVEIAHPALFSSDAHAVAAAPARAEALAGESADAAKAAEGARKAAAAAARDKAASEAKLAREPVSIYISRATQRIYVRRATRKPVPDGGEHFDATIEAPITIRDPDKRIGTHVFTAMARGDSGLRWSAVTIDDADGAKAALDRIAIPKDILDRIGPAAMPRSSIIVSDEPLSKETNYRTEFGAVLNNHPQGGFITRKPTPRIEAPVERYDSFWGGGGFGFFERDPPSQIGSGNARLGGGGKQGGM